MRQADVLYKEEKAAVLTQHDDGSFELKYEDTWVDDQSKPSISLTLPKRKEPYKSKFLFSLFYNMLPEGSNRQVVCKYHKIDIDDYFGILMVTANNDNIGAIRIKRKNSLDD